MNAKRILIRGRRTYRSAIGTGQRLRAGRALGRAARSSSPVKVHLGCGPVYLDGWLNLDIERCYKPDVRLDFRHGLPFPQGSVSHVFSEHVFEHLELVASLRLLGDLHRSLVPSGVLRIAMPDLGMLVARYESGWRDQEWLKDPGYADIDTAAHMLNFALRSWGHLYVYDFEDLQLRLGDAGFSRVQRVDWGFSEHEALRNLERRPDSLLIVEATR